MRQITFEIKKLFKQKAFLLISLLAIIMGVWSVQTVDNPYFFTPLKEYKTGAMDVLYNDIILPLYSQSMYLDPDETRTEMFNEYYELSDRMREDEDYNPEWIVGDIQQRHNHVLAKQKYLDEMQSFIKKFDLSFNEESLPGINWEIKETEYILEHDVVFEEGSMFKNTGTTAAMVLRYNLEELLGIIPLIVLLVLVTQSLPQEILSSTVVNHYLQPKKKTSLIFSKLISFGLLAISYVVIAILTVLIYSIFFKDGIGSFDFPIRTVGFENIITPTWLYVIYGVITFLVLSLFVFSIALLIGGFTKRPILSTLMTLFVIIVLSILTQGSDSLQQWYNPLYALNYRTLIMGTRSIHHSGMAIHVETIAQRYKILIVPLCLSLVFLVITLYVFRQEGYVKSKLFSKEFEWKFIKNEALRFEVKKTASAFPLKIALLTISVILSLIFIQVIVDDQKLVDEYLGDNGLIQLLEEEVVNYEEELKEVDELLNSGSLSEEEARMYSNQRQSVSDFLTSSENTLKTYTNFKRYYDEQNSTSFYRTITPEIRRAFNQGVETGDGSPVVSPQYVAGKPSDFSFNATMDFNQLLRDREIRPIVGTYKINTVYDEFVDIQSKMEMEYSFTPAIITGLNGWHRFSMSYYFDIVLIMLAVLFFGSGFSLEKEQGDHLSFLLTQPQSKATITKNKILASILVGSLFVGSIFIFLFVLSTIVGGIGNYDYPILEYLRFIPDAINGRFKLGVDYDFMNLTTYWFKSIPLFITGLLFSLSFTVMCSVIIKNRLALLSFVLIILAGGCTLAMNGTLGSFTYLLPTSYLHAGAVVDGSLSIIAQTSQLTLWSGLIVLIVSSALCIFITIRLSDKVLV